MKIKELDVVLLHDGRFGTVVEIYESGTVFMLEVCTLTGETIDLPFVKETEIEAVVYRHVG